MGKAMNEDRDGCRAALGFTVKSGWAAVVVLLTGSRTMPRIAEARRIELSDPAVPESRQPYHKGFGTARAEGPELSRLLDSVKRFGTQSVAALICQYTSSGMQLTGIGIVVGSLIDPERITNEHIRIHAREGQLFRRVIEDVAVEAELPCCIWRERNLYATAAEALKQPEQQLRTLAAAMGRGTAGPWRAEQKLATVAGWLMLAVPRRALSPLPSPPGRGKRGSGVGVRGFPNLRRPGKC